MRETGMIVMHCTRCGKHYYISPAYNYKLRINARHRQCPAKPLKITIFPGMGRLEECDC